MTEGSATFTRGHEEYFDFNCSQCLDEECRISEAVAYCPECTSYFCGSCLKDHRRFLVTKVHAVYDETRKNEWGKAKRGPKSGKECPKHSGETITTFCGNHGDLCCSVCASLDHRTCKDMKAIAEIAKGVSSTTEFNQTKTKVIKIIADIEEAKGTQTKDYAEFKVSREQVLSDIGAFKERILATIHRLENNVRDDMNGSFAYIYDDLDSCLLTCERLCRTFEGFKGTLQNTENTDDTQLFITMKLCQNNMAKHGNMIKMLAQPVKPMMFFVENSPLLQDIENACFGEIETDSNFKSNLYRMSSQAVSKSNVKIPTDTSKCYIDGICQMPSGQIIVSDAFNKNIKRLNSSYTVVDSCDVPDRPNAICNTGEKEIVVAMENKGLQFIEVGEQMTKTKSIALGHESFGIAYHGGKLFVSDKKKKIFIHAISGALLRTIQHDVDGSDLFIGTRHLAVSANGTRLYVADRDKGLVVLDKEGKHISTITSPNLDGARGVCLDTHNNVFLLCCMSSNIAQIDCMGEAVLGVIVVRNHGVNAPGAAVFDKYRSTLVVTSSPRSGGDFLDVCQLEHTVR